MHDDVVLVHVERLADCAGKSERVLRACPEFALAIVHPGRAIHRLHRRMREIGHPVLGLDDLVCSVQGAQRVAGLHVGLFVPCPGLRIEVIFKLFEDATLFPMAVSAIVEFDIEPVERFLCLPVAVSNYCDGIVETDYLAHAGHVLHRGRVESFNGATEHRSRLDGRVFHARQPGVDAEHRRAVHLGRNVQPRWRRAHNPELIARLQDRFAGQRNPRSRRREFRERCRAATRLMQDHAVAHQQIRGRYLPLVGCCFEQGDSCSSAGDTHRNLARGSYRRAAAGELHCDRLGRAEEESVNRVDEPRRKIRITGQVATCHRVVGIFPVSGGLEDFDLRPVGIEFIGKHHRQRCMRALAHVRMRHDYRNRVVGRYLEPNIKQLISFRRHELPNGARPIATAYCHSKYNNATSCYASRNKCAS